MDNNKPLDILKKYVDNNTPEQIVKDSEKFENMKFEDERPMMITYTEMEGNKPFDWFVALNCKVVNWNLLYILSSSWVTCACGNQCAIIPRHEENAVPKDKMLEQLGHDFSRNIRLRDKYQSLELLEEIEIRSTELIKEILSESK